VRALHRRPEMQLLESHDSDGTRGLNIDQTMTLDIWSTSISAYSIFEF